MNATADKPWKKVDVSTAQEVLARYELDESLQAALDTKPKLCSLTPEKFLKGLINQKDYLNAVRFLAHALPAREAVWWACQSARVALQHQSNQRTTLAYQTAVAWVQSPTETNRRAAESSIKGCGLEHAAGWAAQAAFWSNGSITASTEPAVAAPPYLYAHAVYGAVALAAAVDDPKQADELYLQLIDQGINIAQGGKGKSPDNIDPQAQQTPLEPAESPQPLAVEG